MVKSEFRLARVLRSFSFNNSQGEYFDISFIWGNADEAVCEVDFWGHPVYGDEMPLMQYTGYMPTVRRDIMKMIRGYLREAGIRLSSFRIIKEDLTLFADYGSNQEVGLFNIPGLKSGFEGICGYDKRVNYYGEPGKKQVTAYFNNDEDACIINKCITDYRGLVSTFKQLVESGQI